MKPRYNLSETRLLSLAQQRARASLAFGGKSANLGEVMNARLPGIVVPERLHDSFLLLRRVHQAKQTRRRHLRTAERSEVCSRSGLPSRAARVDCDKRSKAPSSIRSCRQTVLQKVAREYAGKGLFVRSSSNSEDLPNFSGAGLYTTVPNVRGEQQLIDAIKKVWASLWNFEAYEARERANVDHSKIFMAVLLQEGINSESSGVMISTDPFDTENKGAIYISAKRGLGIKVVEGQRIAEQIIFRPRTNAIQVLTRSAEDSLLTFDEKGGVKEVPITGDRVVLTDEVIRRLVRAATDIKRVFGSRDQDIEWAYMKGQIYIVQSRPFIPGG